MLVAGSPESDGLLEESDTKRIVDVELSIKDEATAFELRVCGDVADMVPERFALDE